MKNLWLFATIVAVCLLIIWFSYVPTSRTVEEGTSLYRVGEDKEYGVVCYKSKTTSGISCVKVR
jgi:hypothetical protein